MTGDVCAGAIAARRQACVLQDPPRGVPALTGERVSAGAATLTITPTDGAGNTRRLRRAVHVGSLGA